MHRAALASQLCGDAIIRIAQRSHCQDCCPWWVGAGMGGLAAMFARRRDERYSTQHVQQDWARSTAMRNRR